MSPHPGPFIREHVIPVGLSVKAAAEKLGVGRPALSNLLNGKAALSAEMAARLERTFGYPAKQLLDMQAAHEAPEAKSAAAKANAYVPPFLETRAAEIETWADGIQARTRLAVFLRTLVNSTGQQLSKVEFPGNDDGERAGWDGVVEAGQATPWIPAGTSGWEFGVNQNPRAKADKDFAKSVKHVPAAERASTTFVFVTPRRWAGKNAWAQERLRERAWKDVRAYDASNLEEWLEQSIPAQVWFANERRVPISGVWSLDRCWQEWTADCDPKPVEALFSSAIEAGRLATKTRLQGSAGNPLVVSADSSLEGLGFLHCVFSAEDSTLFCLRDRVVVFTEPGPLSRLASKSSTFIPVIADRRVEAELAPYKRNLHSIIVYPRNATNADTDIVLEPLHPQAFDRALEAMGCDRDAIDLLSHESGRSLTVLRRRLSTLEEIRTPKWAADERAARSLTPFLFAGSWSVRNDADKAILEMLSGDGARYPDLEQDIAQLHKLEDAPVWSAGNYRGLVSKIDVLFAINKTIVEADLRRFLNVAKLVLSEDDPSLDLPEDERWAAGIHGKVREISAALRDGISETLVLLAVYGNELFRPRLGIDVEREVTSLVESLITPLTARVLEAHSGDLPMYAEAAPDKFLTIIESDLESDEPEALKLMRPASTGLFGRCPRTGLLWALENLAWSPDFMPRTVLALARLSEVVITDNWVNKPSESLSAIFRCWMPQTSVPVAKRVAALEMLVARYPQVGWRICVEQFNGQSKFGMDSHKPRWRSDGHGFGGVVSKREINTFARRALDLALEWRDHSAQTISDLVDTIAELGPDDQAKIWSLIERWTTDASEEDKSLVREQIRVSALSHRGSRRRAKGESADIREKAQEVYDALAPIDPVTRQEWLFRKQWIDDTADETEELNARQRVDRIQTRRTEAIRDILGVGGIDAVVALAERGETSYLIGSLLRAVLRDEEFVSAVASIVNRAPLASSTSRRAMVSGAFGAISDATADGLYSKLFDHIGAEERLAVLLVCPFQRRVWTLVSGFGLDEAYWSVVFPQWSGNSPVDLQFAVEQLLVYERPRAAFHLIHIDLEQIPPKLVFRVMREMLSSGEKSGTYQLEGYSIRRAFEVLNKSGDIEIADMAGLEFAYIDVFDHDEGSVPNLDVHLEQHPELFIQAIVFAYRRKDGAEDPPEYRLDDEEQAGRRAMSAYRLLEKLSRIPGHDRAGQLDPIRIKNWVSRVREGCAEFSRAEVGDVCLGKLFAAAPASKDGAWPCEPVRDVLDEIMTDEMEEGLKTALYNARGVQWRGEGGGLEREEAAKYKRWAASMEFSHPRLAKTLMSMASMYEKEAEWHDTDAVVRKRLRY